MRLWDLDELFISGFTLRVCLRNVCVVVICMVVLVLVRQYLVVIVLRGRLISNCWVHGSTQPDLRSIFFFSFHFLISGNDRWLFLRLCVCAMCLCIWVGSPGACDSVKGLFQKDVCLWRPLTNEWCVCTFSTSSEKEMMMTSSYPKNSGASPFNGGRFGHHRGGSGGGGGLLISLDVTHGWHKASSLVKKNIVYIFPRLNLCV